jgi:hypothetical protein
MKIRLKALGGDQYQVHATSLLTCRDKNPPVYRGKEAQLFRSFELPKRFEFIAQFFSEILL